VIVADIKLVIFDLDGTLVDAYQAVARSLNYTLTTLRYEPIDDDVIKRTVGFGDRHLVGSFVQDDDLDRAIVLYRKHHAEALKEGTKFLPGAKPLLEGLKTQGFRLAIASNRTTEFTHIIIHHLGIDNMFDMVLCGDKVANPKPAADILESILERMGVSPQEALYVGDMTIDIETGRKAGVRTIAVETGSSTASEMLSMKPFRVIQHIGEVGRLVKNMG